MDTIFKEREKKKAKLLDEIKCEDLDEETIMIPIFFTPVFKILFRERKFIKKFLILELNLDKKLEKQNTFYGESILFNNYGPFVKKTSIILKLDRDKIIFTFAEINHKTKNKNTLYELFLNYNKKNNRKAGDKKSFISVNKNIKYYRKIYENGIYLDKKSLLLTVLTTQSFKELYDILIKFFNREETSELIKKLYHASKNRKIIESWKKYQKSLLAN